MTLRQITAALLVIGGLNWGLVGLFQYDLVAAIFGGAAGVVTRIIYTLVGLSALHQLFAYPWDRQRLPVDQARWKKAA